MILVSKHSKATIPMPIGSRSFYFSSFQLNVKKRRSQKQPNRCFDKLSMTDLFAGYCRAEPVEA
jgi:hypothetical protein